MERVKKKKEKSELVSRGKTNPTRNRVAGNEKTGGKDGNRFSPMDSGKSHDRIKRPGRSSIGGVTPLSQSRSRQPTPGRSFGAFPPLGRENVITDLINWTYGGRGTKWLVLPRRRRRADLVSKRTLFGNDNNGSVSIMRATCNELLQSRATFPNAHCIIETDREDPLAPAVYIHNIRD